MRRIIRTTALATAGSLLAGGLLAGAVAPAAEAEVVIDVGFVELDFDYNASVNVHSARGEVGRRCTTSSSEYCVGKDAGDKVLFARVAAADGEEVDAVVTTSSLGPDTRIRYYEVRNDSVYTPRFFWVNLGYPSGTNPGNVRASFEFAFYLGGTYQYRDGVDTGTEVTLRNLRVTGLDIDNHQYMTFHGASSYTLADPSRLQPNPPSDRTTTFVGDTESSTQTQPEYQVMANYGSWRSRPWDIGKTRATADNATFGIAFTDVGFGEYPTVTTNVSQEPDETVAYDPNGGTGTVPPPQVGPLGEQVVVPPGSGLTRECHAFAGWNTAADGSGTAHSPGSTLLIPFGGVTLFAQWTQTCTPSPTPTRPTPTSTRPTPTGTARPTTTSTAGPTTTPTTSPTDDAADREPQRPVVPLGLPDSIAPEGTTEIVRRTVQTNAGEDVRIRVLCSPLRRLAPSGDTGPLCRVTRTTRGAVYVTTFGREVTVRVVARAPGSTQFLPYRKVRVYRTRA